jgi:hypothetical protein
MKNFLISLFTIVDIFFTQVNLAYSEQSTLNQKKDKRQNQGVSKEVSGLSLLSKDEEGLSKRIGLDFTGVRASKFYGSNLGPLAGSFQSYLVSYDVSRNWGVTAFYSQIKMDKDNSPRIFSSNMRNSKVVSSGRSDSFGIQAEIRSKAKGFVVYGRSGLARKNTVYKSYFSLDNIDWYTSDGLPAEYSTELELFGIASAFGCRYVFDRTLLKDFLDPALSIDLLNTFHPISAKSTVTDRNQNLSDKILADLKKELEHQGKLTAQFYYSLQFGVRF